ncbi:Redoxin [Neoconidiobolus thromboides FSU 785]|nr:Redoxin [Neoconidiobolus thromboides FSU 785]
MAIKVGDSLPSVVVHNKHPEDNVNVLEHFKKLNKAILIGVPGAFTPGCSKSHLPSYIERHQEIKNKGIEEVVCVTVNDAFVTQAWSEATKAEGKVTILADFQADLAKALGLDFPAAPLGGTRVKRFAAYIENGVVKKLDVEPDAVGLSCSLANNFLDSI